MYGELFRFDGFEVISFECATDLIAEASDLPLAAIVDAWTARSWEPAIVERAGRDRLIATATTPALTHLWRRLGAARVYLKPISIDEVRADVQMIAARGAPASRTLPVHATAEGETRARERRRSSS